MPNPSLLRYLHNHLYSQIAVSFQLYSDFILKEQPLTYNDTMKIYRDISQNFGTKDSLYNQSVPMRVTLIPLGAVCFIFIP